MKFSFKQSFSFLLLSFFSFAFLGVGMMPLVSYAVGESCTVTNTGATFVYTSADSNWSFFNSKQKCETNQGVWNPGTTPAPDGNNGGTDGGNGSQITGEVTLDKILKAINREIINPAIIGIFAVALAVFIFGVVRFIWAKQEGGGYEKDGKSHMVWGLVGMFIMASAFGIIQFIANTLTLDFKINNDGEIIDPNPPTPPGPPNPPGPSNELYITVGSQGECEQYVGWYYDVAPTYNCWFDGVKNSHYDFNRNGILDEQEASGAPSTDPGDIDWSGNGI